MASALERRAHGPPHDHPSEEVDDGEVEPPLPRRDVRDVGVPDAVKARRRERPVEHVLGHRLERRLGRSPRRLPLRPKDAEPSLTHEPGDPVPSTHHPASAALGVDTAGAVGLAALAVHGADLDGEPAVPGLPGRRRTATPVVVGAGRDADGLAEHADGHPSILLLDHPVPQRRGELTIPTA
jgi:hypothetical protein